MNLNFQYSHHAHDESETVENVTEEEVLQAFDNFDWYGETEKANKIQECSPTLSVLIEPNDHFIWVSSYGEGRNLAFVSECKLPGLKDLDTQSFTLVDAKKALEHFIKSEINELKALFKGA